MIYNNKKATHTDMEKPKRNQTTINITYTLKAKLEELVKHYSNSRNKMTMTFMLEALINEEHEKVFTK